MNFLVGVFRFYFTLERISAARFSSKTFLHVAAFDSRWYAMTMCGWPNGNV